MGELVPIQPSQNQAQTQVQETCEDEGQEEQAREARKHRRALIGCSVLVALGAFVTPFSQVFGLLIVAFATSLLFARAKTAAVLTATIVAAVLFFVAFSRTSMAPYALVCLGVGLACLIACAAIAKGVKQLMLLGAIVLYALCAYGADQWVAMAAGTTVAGQMQDSIQQMQSLLSTTSGIDLNAVVSLMASLWPFTYFVRAFVVVAIATIAARVTLKRWMQDFNAPPFLEFDVSFAALWILVFGIVCVVLSRVLSGAVATTAQIVGINVIMCIRLPFLVQGIAAMLGALRKKGVGAGICTLVMCVLCFAELSFFLLSIIGLVDLWLNLRKLPRGAACALADSEKACENDKNNDRGDTQ